ncbi:3-ketoacyl-CoA synthase 7 [Camellia lanceoleosa]|uniref:3-ketoacyl-CoA synthase 7 n=1 Tax=Camellia lanceoleosa TaxID=1840588 RepID=A0ACC0IJI4_9ERIC|nr:3-ketoacyl-CoA synthase 7 [Camellia lanceoleosa]
MLTMQKMHAESETTLFPCPILRPLYLLPIEDNKHQNKLWIIHSKLIKNGGIIQNPHHRLTYHQIQFRVPHRLLVLPPTKSLTNHQCQTPRTLQIMENLEQEARDFLSKVVKSLFCPTPSITATIMNKFGFQSNVKSVSLGRMGCSAGLLSVSLAKDLLKVHKNSIALVLSMEVVTPNGYHGKARSMLLANALFRMGPVAVLLAYTLSRPTRDRTINHTNQSSKNLMKRGI